MEAQGTNLNASCTVTSAKIGVCERRKNIRQTRWQTIGSKKLLFYRLFFVYDRVNDWLKRVILASLTNANFNNIQITARQDLSPQFKYMIFHVFIHLYSST